jgi:hypothetical protein
MRPPSKIVSSRGVRLYIEFCLACNLPKILDIYKADTMTRSNQIEMFFLWLLICKKYSFGTCVTYFKQFTSLMSILCDTLIFEESPWTKWMLKFLSKNMMLKREKRLRIPWGCFVFAIFNNYTDFDINSDSLTYFTIITLGTFGLFRSGELVPRTQRSRLILSLQDVTLFHLKNDCLYPFTVKNWLKKNKLLNIQLVSFRIKRTKGRPLGETIWISSLTCLGELSPIKLLLKYFQVKANLFNGENCTLFLLSNGKPLTYSNLNNWVHNILKSFKINIPNISLHHSTRGYGFRLLQNCLAPEWLILGLGRWLGSNSYLLYSTIRLSDIIKWQNLMGYHALKECNLIFNKLLINSTNCNHLMIYKAINRFNIKIPKDYSSTTDYQIITVDSYKPASIISLGLRDT